MLYRIPLVFTAHSLEPLRPWKREQLGPGSDLTTWLERTAIEAADAVIAVSQEMREDVLRLFEVSPEKVVVIGNGVDTDEYRRTASQAALARYGIDPARPYVLFVGRISRQKGILHLVRAIPDLPPSVQVVLCASAPDTPEIAAELEAAVTGVQAARPGVIWIREMADRPTVIQLYSHAAVFCCPSVYEPFGIINLEAMACEVPVVASAVGGIREVVADGETGMLVQVPLRSDVAFEPAHPARFSRDLAAALTRLLGDAERRRAMGLAGRRRAEALYSWRAVAKQVLAVYELLVARGV
jgi:glycogen synthase